MSFTPFHGAVPSSSAALHSSIPLTHFRMYFGLFEELYLLCSSCADFSGWEKIQGLLWVYSKLLQIKRWVKNKAHKFLISCYLSLKISSFHNDVKITIRKLLWDFRKKEYFMTPKRHLWKLFCFFQEKLCMLWCSEEPSKSLSVSL